MDRAPAPTPLAALCVPHALFFGAQSVWVLTRVSEKEVRKKNNDSGIFFVDIALGLREHRSTNWHIRMRSTDELMAAPLRLGIHGVPLGPDSRHRRI